MRFKIDVYNSSTYFFGLYVHRRFGWMIWRWEMLQTFQTRDEAISLYEKIKDLPEYLP